MSKRNRGPARKKKNFRGALQLFDDESHMFASSSSQAQEQMTSELLNILEPPEKRARIAVVEEPPEIYSNIFSPGASIIEPEDDDEGDEAPTLNSMPQGASKYMREFQDHFPVLLDYVLAAESHPLVGQLCSCEIDGATRTCICNNCTFYEPKCPKCFIADHKHNPWHWVEVWNGQYFDRKDISQLGHIVTIGHNGAGDRCPHNESTTGLDFILVDTTGVHQTKFLFCQCVGVSPKRYHHLMQAKIFPASIAQPEMGFTFDLLRDFHHHTLVSKKSSYDYIGAIRQKSNNAFTSDVPDPYRQFLRVKRVWSALSSLKKAGQLHSIDRYLPYRSPGSIVVPCFGCPEPGFNVPDEQWEIIDEDFRHINMLYLMEDGHFGLQRYAKVDDPEDVALLGGRGFFPEDTKYNEYVQNVVANAEEKSSCSKFNAILMQNMLKFKGCVITGVVACECGRHCMFISEVDLQKGERFANADYAFAMALSRYSHWFQEKKALGDAKYFFQHILLTYDVACQYSKNLRQRFNSHFPDIADIIDLVHTLVPKMHLDGHKDDCKIRFSLNYFKGAGRSHGEGIEASWAETKQCGGSTRQMNHGHRHDSLTEFHNFWNWKKLQGMAASLEIHLVAARKSLEIAVDHFIGLSAIRSADVVARWGSESSSPQFKNGKWISVYSVHFEKLPSQQEIYQSFENLEDHYKNLISSQLSNSSPSAQVIHWGIKIQQKQNNLKHTIKYGEISDADLHRLRQTLATEFRRFRKHQQESMSMVNVHISQREPAQFIEDEKLFLPSDLSSTQRAELNLEGLSLIEIKLREGEANDAVSTICNAVIHQMLLRETKHRHSAGVNQNLRSQLHINRVKDKRTLAAAEYRQARNCLLMLHDADELEGFPPLKDSDMWAKNATGARQLGEGSETDSWIWTYGRLRNMSDDEKKNFLLATEKVQWFRAKADTERWIEEVEILEEEFRRFIRSCQKMTSVWRSVSEDHPEYEFPKCYDANSPISGYRVYALQKSAMFFRMGSDAEEKMNNAGGSWPAPGENICDHLRARRPSLQVISDIADSNNS